MCAKAPIVVLPFYIAFRKITLHRMKHISAFLLALMILTVFASCARRRGVDVGMNYRREAGWHRGQGYGHGTGYYHAPRNYRR